MLDDTPKAPWWRRLSEYARHYRRDLLVGLAAAVAATVITALVPLVFKVIVDDAITAHRRSLNLWIAVLVAAAIAAYGLNYVRRYYAGRIAHHVQYELRRDVFAALLRLDGAQQDQLSNGQVIGKVTSDLQLVQNLLYLLPVVFGEALLFLLSIVVMVALSPPLTLITILVVPPLWFIAHRSRQRLQPATAQAQEKTAAVFGVVDAAVSGLQVVKGFGQEHQEMAKLSVAARRLYRAQLRVVALQARYEPALRNVPLLGQVALIALGGWLAANSHITIGTFLAFATYLAELAKPVSNMAATLTTGQRAGTGAERVFELIDSRPTLVDGTEQLPPNAPPTIEFDQVTFAYDPDQPVLRNLTMRVRPGETLALVGAAGSGKSTVAQLAARCYDVTSGAVRIGGRDVRDLTLDSLRAAIGLVPEDAFLFTGTVRTNIAYGHPEASHEEVVAAARAAGADGFIAALPDGYDTLIGASGLTLSGGQRQRIALARALLPQPLLLLLDDPTSAVDAATESEIQAALGEIIADHTTLLIVRRRSTLALADRIAVLDDGNLIDIGTHAELQARCRHYRLLLTPEDAQDVGALDDAHGAQESPPLPTSAPSEPPPIAVEPALFDTDENTGAELRQLMRGSLGALLLSLVMVGLDAAAALLLPLLIRHGLDAGVRPHVLSVLWLASLAGAVVVAVQWTTQWAAELLTGRTGERLLYALRSLIFAHVQRFGFDAFEHDGGSRIITAITTDVDAVVSFLEHSVVTASISVVTFVGILATLFAIDATLALPVFAALPLLIAVTWAFRRASKRTYGRAREHYATVIADLREHVAGLRIVQGFRTEDRSAEVFARSSDAYRQARVTLQRLFALYFPFVQLVASLAEALVLAIGGHRVVAGTLSIGELIAFLLFIELLFTPVDQLSQVFDTYQQAEVSGRRIRDLLRTPSGTPPAAMPLPVGSLRGDVVFDNVHFRYGSRPTAALGGIELQIPAGQTVVFVGSTGAGKSTLIKLAARFYDPTGGAVRVDGHDLRELDLDGYRRRLGIVTQEPYLFAGTVRDAIAYGWMDATDAQVEQAARAVGAHNMIAALDGGYRHVLTTGGRNLSVGQRQLIALARAQHVDPDILLLDEATSALDLATETLVHRATFGLARHRTTLIVAHRLTTALHADRVVVLDNGRIVEDGSHPVLLAAGGRYTQLWDAYTGSKHSAGSCL